MDPMEQSQGSIDEDLVCVACGTDTSPEQLVICDSCDLGFHTSCFSLAAVPEGDWHCPGCTALHQLCVGALVVTESPQNMYAAGSTGAAEPHHTQVLCYVRITALGPMDAGYDDGSMRQVQLLQTSAPLLGSARFYSKSTLQPLERVPQRTSEGAQQLYRTQGSATCTVTLCSSRYAMFGSPAAAVGASTEAWLAGPDCIQQAQQLLAGPARQMHLCSSGSSSGSSDSGSRAPAAADRAAQAGVAPAATSAVAAAVAAGHVCVGCNTAAAGRPMECCSSCRLWSCRAPCGSSIAPAAGSRGRSRRQGAGQRWHCPNPLCVLLQELPQTAAEEGLAKNQPNPAPQTHRDPAGTLASAAGAAAAAQA